MRPRERALAIWAAWMGTDSNIGPKDVVEDISSAIRDAEDSAREEAAKMFERFAAMTDRVDIDWAAAAVRALKHNGSDRGPVLISHPPRERSS